MTFGRLMQISPDIAADDKFKNVFKTLEKVCEMLYTVKGIRDQLLTQESMIKELLQHNKKMANVLQEVLNQGHAEHGVPFSEIVRAGIERQIKFHTSINLALISFQAIIDVLCDPTAGAEE